MLRTQQAFLAGTAARWTSASSYLHACAAARNCTLRSDIFSELVRENDLITEPVSIKNARAVVPQAPGLGVQLDIKTLEEYRVH